MSASIGRPSLPEDLYLQKLIAHHTPKPKRKTDDGLVPKLIERALELGARLYRNNVGTLRDRFGHYVTYGLCVGSSDLIGYTKRVIQPQDVGRTVAVFTAIEAKSASGRASDRQVAFVERVRADGGIAQIVRSVQELEYTLGPK